MTMQPFSSSWLKVGCFSVFLLSTASCLTQTLPSNLQAKNTDADLANSPGFALSIPPDPALQGPSGASQPAGAVIPVQIAPKYNRIVKADQTALPLTFGDKMGLALRQRTSVTSFASTLFSAGFAHLTDSRPHFGTDKAGFGERLGGAELRQSVEAFLTYGVYAGAFQDDPRYYVLGPSHTPTKRAIYAAERIVITRKDNGHAAINWPRLAGTATAQAFANSYYPERDRDAGKTIQSVLSSYGTGALINEVHEFAGDIVRHFRNKP